MSYLLAQIWLCLLIAGLIGLIIGWLLRGGCKNKVVESKVSATTNKPMQVRENEVQKINVGTEPELLKGPRNGKKDNLTLVKGIGGVLEDRLNELGVYHFSQIASWTLSQQEFMDERMSFPGRIERENWVSQAKQLASGIQTEFSKRVAEGNVPSSNQH